MKTILAFALIVLACAQESPLNYAIETNGREVTLRVTNAKRTPITLLRWGTPFDRNTPFRADMFNIESEDGYKPPYAGVWLKRVLAAGDFIYLGPGESIRGVVRLDDGYWFQRAGRYVANLHIWVVVADGFVELPGRSQSSEEDPFRAFTEYPLDSERFVFDVSETEAKINPPGWWDAATPMADVDYNKPSLIPPPKTYNCNASQTTAINAATASCKTYAKDSKAYLDAGYIAPAKRYTTWFGAYDLTRWTTVQQQFGKIKERTVYSSYEVDCYCESQYQSAYAYVYSGSCCRIHVCSLFWAAPNTGTDSRAGTLIHELSHFNIVGDTNDYKYGQAACKQLAISNPNNAIHNADSHEYFAENTPFQT